MATTAFQPAILPPRARGFAWGRAFRLLPVAIALIVSAIELALADRKFGLFSGGFGISRAVDTLGEAALFLVGYAAVQMLIALAGWAFAVRVTRGRAGWTPAFVFALTNGAIFVGVIAAQYKLASYFSDAVGFALLAQLGGGSLADALLFGLSEIGLALVVIGCGTAAAWLAWKALARLPLASFDRPQSPRPLSWLVVVTTFIALAIAIPRSGSDAAYALNRTLAWAAMGGLLDRATDFDRDGYGLFGVQHDTHPFDPARHPLALDVPGNGIDEDGYGGDLKLVPLAATLEPQVFSARAPHVIIVVFESTRGDVLGQRVDGRPVAPNLDALVSAGSVARPAFSHVGFTTESLKSLFAGQLAPREGDPSLFADLKASGYRIGVFSGQPEDFGGISETVAMRRNADVYFDAETLREKRAFDFAAQGSLRVDEGHLLAAFDRTLGREDWSARRHMAYFNFQSAHFPYDHPGVARRLTGEPIARGDITPANAERVRQTYWNAVANADRRLGELIARLKAKGVWEDTLLFVAGDHGEELFESGFLGHGHVIGTEQFATLLVANRPGVLPRGPIALSDYRAIIAAAIKGVSPPMIEVPPFLHIGPLDTPTAIGLAEPQGIITSLRLDTGEVCFRERDMCTPYSPLTGADRARADAVVARWGSERWRERLRAH
ncbi:sulfatase-like hydrolase/transferase [Tsuneonella sp. HG249]